MAFWGTQAELLANDAQANDYFGTSVDLSGSLALVGSVGDDDAGNGSGAAYVFVESAGAWSQQQKLTAADAQAGDHLGTAVALEGDTALTGAWEDDDNGNAAGSAYVFVDSAGVWSQQQKLLASDGQSDDQFGRAVALHHDTALIGADGVNAGAGNTGAAYVFVRSAATWTEQAKLVASDAAGGDNAGHAVAVFADTAVVGAHLDDDVEFGAGSAYVFVRSAATWTEQTKLVASDPTSLAMFGHSVALWGDVVVVGATGAGAGYVFQRSATSWTEQAKLTPNSSSSGGGFGWSADIEGTMLAFGAFADDHVATQAGSVYTFVRNASVWSQQARVTANDAAANDVFGEAVALDGGRLLVGAHNDDDGASDGGAAYVMVPGGLGMDCTLDAECDSGHCVDGLCCDGPCGGGALDDCQACSIANGAAVDGSCGPILAGTPCRQAVDVCDAEEVCDGLSLLCPGDGVHPSGTPCRPGVAACDAEEVCDGSSTQCPGDGVLPSGTTCRLTAGSCDTEEVCDGLSLLCPGDAVLASGTACRAAAGLCDVEEACDGVSSQCPSDHVLPSGTVCRAALGDCDAEEACDGVGNQCPSDGLLSSGTVCRPVAGACDVEESCDGASDECPDDALLGSGIVCRAAAGDCDIEELCDGAAPSCPMDVLAAVGTACRPAGHDCDAEEVCDGSHAACPSDESSPNGRSCDDGDPCTTGDECEAGVCASGPYTCEDIGDTVANPVESSEGCGCRLIRRQPGRLGGVLLWASAAGLAYRRRRRTRAPSAAARRAARVRDRKGQSLARGTRPWTMPPSGRRARP